MTLPQQAFGFTGKPVFASFTPANAAKSGITYSPPKNLSIPKTGGGSTSSRQTSKTVAPPALFSLEGQRQAVGRVANVLNPFQNTPVSLVNPLTGNVLFEDVGAPVRGAVRVAEIGTLAWLGSFFTGGVSATAKSATATTTGTGLFTAAQTGLAAGALGFGAGLLFGSGSSSKQDATQTTNPQQETNPEQITKPFQDTNVAVQPTIGGSDQNTAGRDIFTNRQNYTYTLTYPMQSTTPSQSVIPTQETIPSQSQTASTGMNWGLLALIAGGVYVLTRK